MPTSADVERSAARVRSVVTIATPHHGTPLASFFATLRGPGTVWLQSLPLSRLANRIVAAVPGLTGRGAKGEGSILGGLGGLLDGDNS